MKLPHLLTSTKTTLSTKISAERLLLLWGAALWVMIGLSAVSPSEAPAGLISRELQIEGLTEGGARVGSRRGALGRHSGDPSGVIALTGEEGEEETLCAAALIRPRVALLSAECARRVQPQRARWGARGYLERDARVVSVSVHESGVALALLSAPIFAPTLRPAPPRLVTPEEKLIAREGAQVSGAASGAARGAARGEARELVTLSTYVLRPGAESPRRQSVTVARRDGERAARLALSGGQGAREAVLTGGRGDLFGFISAEGSLLLTPEVTGWARELGERLTLELNALASAG